MPDMAASAEIGIPTGQNAADSSGSLTRAFVCFTEAAGSLERYYLHLQEEVARLRRELEQRNAELNRSLKANERIRESLHQILEGLPCGVLVVSAQGEILTANPEARRLLNSTPNSLDELAGTHPEFRVLLDRAQSSSREWELEIHSTSGECRSLATRHARLNPPEHGGESIFILEDVTERKRLMLERERLERQQALAGMSTVLAHEIRNPLASLELFVGFLAESDLEEEHHLCVEHLQAGLRMLSATVNNVLHFHRAASPRLAPLDLGQLLSWISDFLRPLARQSSVQLRLDNHLAEVEMPADRHALEQVLLNLAINALRFMPGGGFLTMAGQRENEKKAAFATITISDSGPGIAVENLQRIFEPGFTTRQDSPGLGLAVCQTIVAQHGGTIEALNRPEGGASFVVRLPLGETA